MAFSLRSAVASAITAALLTVVSPMVASDAEARTYTVGGKAFTEQYVLAEITRQLLEREGYEAVTRVGYATDAIRAAQIGGEVDISWDYTWTGYAFHNGLSEPKPVDQVLEEVRRLDEDQGLVWLERSNVNNTYAIAVNLDFAAEACIHSMSDLARVVRNGAKLRMASDQECHKREDCWLAAQRAYNFQFPRADIEVMNVNETYEALRERRADIAVVYTTDGKIPAYDLELLKDSRSIFAEYYLVPVVRADVLAAEPRIQTVLESISAAMDTATQQDLHYRIDVVGQPIEAVARYFITSKNL
ncbi:MAG: glycine betaine ABC transporter substrate-binding protein [Pseudomonadota bacterium]